MRRKRTMYWIGLVVAMVGLSANGTQSDYKQHGRVSYDAGGTLVKGVSEVEWSHATVNTLIMPGDILWTDKESTTEVEFAGGVYLRMADGSKAEVVSLSPEVMLRGWHGSFYIQRLKRSPGKVFFSTPAGSIEVNPDTAARVDILKDGATTVTTHWGRVTLRSESGGAVFVNDGQRAWVDPGVLPSLAMAFDRSVGDAFDAWNRQRAKYLAQGGQGGSSKHITNSVIGLSELDTSGEWVYVDDTPCWRPTTVVDYVPYRYGQWNYVHDVGHVWVGHYPFSYVTSHHGYWRYNRSHGWLWSYHHEWRPAWAATVRYGDYYVWAPIDYYHRPVRVYSHAGFHLGGVGFGFFASSYVHYNHLYHGSHHIYGAHHDIFGGSHHGRDINIWNITVNNNNPVRTRYDSSIGRARTYRPERTVRGTTMLNEGIVRAQDRVRGLEQRVGRTSFRPAVRTEKSPTNVRTTVNDSRRSTSVRQVRINQVAPSYTRASTSKPESAANRFSRGSGPSKPTVTNRSIRSTRESRSSGTTATPLGRTRSVWSDGPKTTTRESIGSPSRTRTSVRSDSPSTSRERVTSPSRTRTSTRHENTLRTPRKVNTVDTHKPQTITTPSSRPTYSRPTYTRPSAQSPRDVAPAPSRTSRSASGPRTTRRESAAPSPSYRPQTAPRRVQQSAPQRQVQRSRPQSVQKQSAPAPRVRQSAPSSNRSVRPQSSSPPPRSSVSRSTAPSRSSSSAPRRSTSSSSRRVRP